MDLDFIQEQLDNFSTFGGAIEDIFSAIRELFGVETELLDEDGEGTGEFERVGTLNGLSSYLETSSEAENADAGDNGDNGDTDAEGSSLPGSSEPADDVDAETAE